MKFASILLRKCRSEATNTEREIINYILENADDIVGQSIHEVARNSFTSPTSITRLCKKMGYSGYRSFQEALIAERVHRESFFSSEITDFTKNDTLEVVMQKAAFQNMQAIENLRKMVNTSEVLKVMELIHTSQNVVLFGLGASQMVAQDAQLKFYRVGKNLMSNPDWHNQLLMARNVKKGDLAIVISYSGETEEMLKCSQVAKENGATLVSITREGTNRISHLANLPLFVPNTERYFRIGAMSSRIAQLTVIDMIFSAYIRCHYDSIFDVIERTQIQKGGANIEYY